MIVVLALGLLWLIWPSGDAPAPQVPPEQEQVADAKPPQPAPAPESEAEPEAETPKTAGDTPEVDPQVGEVAGPAEPPVEDPTPSRAPDQETREVRVRLLDADDRPVPGVLFRYADSNEVMERASRSGFIIATEMLTHSAVTDTDGWFTVALGYRSALLLRMEHAHLVLRGAPDTGDSRAGMMFTLPTNSWLVAESVSETILHCDPATQVIIEMHYADGQPFTGVLTYSVWMDAGGRRSGQVVPPVQVRNDTEYVIEGLHPDAHLWGNIESTRPGFARTTVFRQPVSDGDRIVLIVARSERPQWGVIVDLSILEEDERVEVLLVSSNGGVFPMQQHGPGEVRSPNLASMDGYRVYVIGENISWVSEPTNLAATPFEWQRIVVPRQAPVTVEMTIVDQEGEPIQPAIVLRDNRSYGNWSNPESHVPHPSRVERDRRRSPMQWVAADSNGHAVYVGLAAGTRELVVEAHGYFHRVIEYTAAPGETVHLGEVVMERIPPGGGGSVEVRLIGAPDPTKYALHLGSPLGSDVIAPTPFSADGTVKLSELDFRAYRLSILPVGGGSTVAQVRGEVLLEPTNPTFLWEPEYPTD
jgi:hypothetical protein